MNRRQAAAPGPLRITSADNSPPGVDQDHGGHLTLGHARRSSRSRQRRRHQQEHVHNVRICGHGDARHRRGF